MADDATNDDDQFQTNNPDDTNPMAAMKDDKKQAGDYSTPFSPPTGVQDRIDDTHPSLDAKNSEQEGYDAGAEAAAGGNFPGQAADEDPNLDEVQDIPEAQ
jgi:hypothetical protein